MNTENGINSFENIRTMIKTSGSGIRFNLSFPYSNYLYICCHAIDNNLNITSSPVSMLLDLNRTTYYNGKNFYNTGNSYSTGAYLNNVSNTALQIILSYQNSASENWSNYTKGMIIYQYFT